MSKNKKISIYIAISISALIFLLISFVSIKASFGGLNLNIFGEGISDELKQNYSFDSDIENIVLKRSNKKGFYLEIEKIQISDANGLVLETSLISWDFNLFNLITFSIDEKNKISSEKINIKYLQSSNIIKKKYEKIKILGQGEIKDKLNLEVHYLSNSAKEKLSKNGSTIKILESK